MCCLLNTSSVSSCIPESALYRSDRKLCRELFIKSQTGIDPNENMQWLNWLYINKLETEKKEITIIQKTYYVSF